MKVRTDVAIGFASDVGLRRVDNQDDILVYEPRDAQAFAQRGRLIGLADGMGGSVGGGEASRLALRALLAAWLDVDVSAAVARFGAADGLRRCLASAFEAAQHALDRAAAENPRLDGMGTTLTAFVQVEDRIVGVHIGDSRCLWIGQDGAKWLTSVHASALEESRLTKALVARAEPASVEADEPDFFEAELVAGDRVLLMSDGLWRAIPEAEGLATVHSCALHEAVPLLLERARAIDGSDNASVCMLEYRGARSADADDAPVEVAESKLDRPRLPLRAPRGPSALARAWPGFLILVGIVLLGVAAWIRWR